MSGVQMKRPGDSCQSHPGQQRNGRSDASWKYTPMKRAVVLSNRDFLTQAFGRCGTDETPWVAGFPGDPVPQAIILTGIVVAFAATTLAAALVLRLAAADRD